MTDDQRLAHTLRPVRLIMVAAALIATAAACSKASHAATVSNPTLSPIPPFTVPGVSSGQLRPGSLPVSTWDGSDTVKPATTSSTTTTTTTTQPKPPPPPPILPSDVLFDTDSAILKPGAPPVLKKLADQIAREAAAARLRFIGFTDSRGTPGHNLDLSRRRAEAVLVWFAGYGFDTGRMSAIGEGETQLLVPDTTAQGQFIPAAGQKNRRVEIQILP